MKAMSMPAAEQRAEMDGYRRASQAEWGVRGGVAEGATRTQRATLPCASCRTRPEPAHAALLRPTWQRAVVAVREHAVVGVGWDQACTTRVTQARDDGECRWKVSQASTINDAATRWCLQTNQPNKLSAQTVTHWVFKQMP